MWTLAPGDSVGAWSDTLAADPFRRRYHSAAVLLPDGRVLTSGGAPSDNEASIFWPPYLYASDDGTLRTRPSITASCHLDAPIHYDESFRVEFTATTDVMGSACLIRPSAVTHQSDMGQRFVPLAFDSVGVGYVKLRAPADSNAAPPGDHMLFLVRTDGTPSVAKWVRLERDETSPSASEFSEPEIGPGGLIILSWAAPGDDGEVGRATSYDLRYSTSPITEQNFNSAASVSTGIPQCSGTGESATFSGTCGSTYYFGLKTKDEVHNWSSLTTTSSPAFCGGGGLMAGGDEGGGGAEGFTAADIVRVESVAVDDPGENSVLSPALPGDAPTDRLRVRPALAGGRCLALRLRQPAGGAATLDEVAVVAVDHPDGSEVFVSSGGVIVGARRDIGGLWITSGVEATPVDLGSEGGPFKAGDTLVAVLGPSAPGVARAGLAIDAWGASAGGGEVPGGIRVASASDSVIQQVVPRSDFAETLVETAADTLRLVFQSQHRVRRLSVVDHVAGSETSVLSAVAATHSRLGDVASHLATADSLVTTMQPGDTLSACFAPAPVASGQARAYVLVVRGKSAELSGPQSQPTSEVLGAPPRAFHLAQNRPNPFSERTVVGFDLPVKSDVRLEVFDVGGAAGGGAVDSASRGGSARGRVEPPRWCRTRCSAGYLPLPPACRSVRRSSQDGDPAMTRMRATFAVLVIGCCGLVTPEVARSQIVEAKFQVTSLPRTPESGALETEADVAGPGDSLVAVWSDLGSGGCRHRVGVAISIDNGSTWQYGGNIIGTTDGNAMPSIYWSEEH